MRYAKITAPELPGAGAPTPFIIADDSLPRGPGSRFLVSGWPGFEQIVQKAAYLDGTYQTNLAKENRDVTFELLAEYEFPSEDDCFSFTCLFHLYCPLEGLLEMGVVGGTGVSFPYATISSVRPAVSQNDGQVVSMRLLYQINAGPPAFGSGG